MVVDNIIWCKGYKFDILKEINATTQSYDHRSNDYIIVENFGHILILLFN